MTTTPTLYLRERRPRVCRLAPDEVRHLLAHHRAHLDLAPTPAPHVWQVTPAGVAGVLLTPRRRVVIAPKIAIRNLLFLTEQEGEPDQVAPAEGGDVLDLLARRLARLMAERARGGLHRDYRETAHEGPYLVGQLDLPAQLRRPAGRKDQLHSRQDAFTAELPCNQVPRTIAGLLAASPLLSDGLRCQLLRAQANFAHVSATPLTPDVLSQLRSPRLPEAYRPLADLCLLLASALAPGTSPGATSAPALLVSLERWFEQYLTRTIEEIYHADPSGVAVQRTRLVGRPDVTIRPDVTLDSDEKVCVVVDAKWKRLGDAGPESADFYQVLSYATLLGAKLAVLVYPGRRGRGDWTFDHTPVRVLARTLDVAGSGELCRRSRRRLGRVLCSEAV